MSRPNTSVLLAILGGLSFTVSAESVPDLPEDWRFPVTDELKGNFIREQSGKDYIEASADFNSDGISDTAYLVKSKKFSGEAIIVSTSSNDGFKWHVLNVISWGKEYPNVGIAMGVDVVPPGSYKTACGKGYWACKDDEVPLLELEFPAINYFRFGSAASFFYWSKEASSFKRIWVSD